MVFMRLIEREREKDRGEVLALNHRRSLLTYWFHCLKSNNPNTQGKLKILRTGDESGGKGREEEE